MTIFIIFVLSVMARDSSLTDQIGQEVNRRKKKNSNK